MGGTPKPRGMAHGGGVPWLQGKLGRDPPSRSASARQAAKATGEGHSVQPPAGERLGPPSREATVRQASLAQGMKTPRAPRPWIATPFRQAQGPEPLGPEIEAEGQSRGAALTMTRQEGTARRGSPSNPTSPLDCDAVSASHFGKLKVLSMSKGATAVAL